MCLPVKVPVTSLKTTLALPWKAKPLHLTGLTAQYSYHGVMRVADPLPGVIVAHKPVKK